jgi:hypothetical protein
MRWLPVGIVVSLFAAQGASAQTMPSAAEQMLNEMLKPSAVESGRGSATQPWEPQVLLPAGYHSKHSGSGLLREGSDIIAQHGKLKKVPDSPYSQFVFDKSSGSTLAPMLVLPNLQLMSMEDASAATKENIDFTVSGTVTEYKGKNYILLEPGPDAVSRQMPIPATEAAPSAKQPASADQMLKDMLSADKAPVPVPSNAVPLQRDLTSGPGAVAPHAPALTVLPEQSQIFDRVCRLSTTNDGMHEQLTFDSDGAEMRDPPLIVLPNLKLVDLEKVAGDLRNTRVRVTGIITEYRGRNYILLQKVVVMAESDRQF